MAVSTISSAIKRIDLTSTTDASRNQYLGLSLPRAVICACSDEGGIVTPFLSSNGRWYLKAEQASTEYHFHYWVI